LLARARAPKLDETGDRSISLSAPVMLPNAKMNPLFYATVQATEEAIVNAMVAADTMTGANGIRVFALPHDRLRSALRKYNRLEERSAR
jgi:L-aminopeptidase/D-esterase-like protein